MKILMVVDSLGAGGKERQLVGLIQALKECQRSESILVVMSKNIHYAEVERSASAVHVLERRWKRDPTVWPRLSRIVKDVRPDIIHSWDPMTSFYCAPIALVHRIPLVIEINDAPRVLKFTDKRKIIASLTFPLCRKIVANSYAGLHAYNIDGSRGCVIHNGFDFVRTQNLPDVKKMRGKFCITTPSVVGMVARFDTSKDYKTFFSAAKIVLGRRSDVTFLAIGDGPTFQQFRSEDNIRLLGSQVEVEAIVQMFDVGVLCTFTEGVSNSIIEYMGLSKPVVATRCDGTSETIDDDLSGILVPASDPLAVAEAIESLLNDPAKRAAYGKQGRRKVETDFSTTAMVGKFSEVYNEVLGGRRSRKK
jgi:glycosyltransferase involved in cell wall biosynthesis